MERRVDLDECVRVQAEPRGCLCRERDADARVVRRRYVDRLGVERVDAAVVRREHVRLVTIPFRTWSRSLAPQPHDRKVAVLDPLEAGALDATQ